MKWVPDQVLEHLRGALADRDEATFREPRRGEPAAPPTLIADRYEIQERLGEGGMGTVYRALDRETGTLVAVKVLHAASADLDARFARESAVLAELSDPAIVRYLGHGRSSAGPYLVMELLEGTTLAARLLRSRLTIAQTLEIGETVARALGAVHARGLVHRDVKPSNVFLLAKAPTDPGGTRVKLLDLGLARRGIDTEAMTRTGCVLGTCGYMAPEQARAARTLDARVDVFALGCVLFECLTGKPAFDGVEFVAVLSKILFEHPPRVGELAPGISGALEDLVVRMLSKDPTARPADGSEVAERLALLRREPTAAVEARRLTERERRMAWVLMATGVLEDYFSARHGWHGQDGRTLTDHDEAELWGHLEEVVHRFGAALEAVADGSVVVVIGGEGAAPDHASRAARCALALRAVLPEAAMALAAGRLTTGAVTGEAIDEAARLTRAATPVGGFGDGSGRRRAPIGLDAASAALLEGRFEIAFDRGAPQLVGELGAAGGSRTLLGKATPCVGRDVELRTLEALLDACEAGPVARPALVTGPPGAGKSRLLHELWARIALRRTPVEVLLGRGDPLSASTPLGLVAQAIRGAARLVAGEPPRVSRYKVGARVSRRVGSAEALRVAQFLGELAGTPFPDEQAPELRAARADPILMADQVRRAWEDWLRAECAAQPVMLVLEDLHWCDGATVRFVDATLRTLRSSPLIVLALARPEVHAELPDLWAERGLSEVRLAPLSPEASEALARAVLGARWSSERIARIVEHADGNAFTLEELLRAEAEGRADAFPGTVVAMLEARLGSLDPQARRVLRAGSIFGRVFWKGAAAELLGAGTSPTELDAAIDTLERREWIARRAEARFQGEVELAFRHALVRDAAYAMLTEEDGALGHRLAGDWLARAGERDASVIAEHFVRGGAPRRALEWYARAAQHALEANDLAAAIANADRAAGCGAGDEMLGELSLVRAVAHRWRGEIADSEKHALEAMRVLPSGTSRWWVAAGEAVTACAVIGRTDRLQAIADELRKAWPEGQPAGVAVVAVVRAAAFFLYAGLPARAEPMYALALATADRFVDDMPVHAWLQQGRAVRALFAGDASAYRELTEAAAVAFERAGDARTACARRINAGFAWGELGAYAEAAAGLRAALAEAERMSLRNAAALARQCLGFALSRQGELEEAIALQTVAAHAFAEQGDRRLEGASRIYLAETLLRASSFERAEEQARKAMDALDTSPPLQPYALATLAAALLALGRNAEALEAAARGNARLHALAHVERGEGRVRLVLAEALEAMGDVEGARTALVRARDRLLERAAKISDVRSRDSFLERIEEHARTLARSTTRGDS